MNVEINNKRLKKSMEELSIKVFSYYNGIFGDNLTTYDNLQVSIILHQQEDNVKEMEEFKVSIKLMNVDQKINGVLGKLVGTMLQKSSVGNAEECILGFVKQLYLKNKKFNVNEFSSFYERFEELFYSDSLNFIDRVRLNNFKSEVEIMELEEGLAIKKIPHVIDEQTRIHEMIYKPYIQFSRSDFVIERRYSRAKRIGESNTSLNSGEINREANESGDLFDLVIRALRLLKSSAVFRDQTITTETLTFMRYAGLMSRFPFIENIILGDKCTLTSTETEELKKVFTKLRKNDDSRFRIASSRLSYGLERRLNEDKLLDYMIGLESLYLPGKTDELSFRLSLRASFITNDAMSKRKEVFRFIRRMYDSRSNIVHGNQHELTLEDIKKLEELLRVSLKIWMEDANKFKEDKVKKGILIKEGLLDSIYFKE